MYFLLLFIFNDVYFKKKVFVSWFFWGEGMDAIAPFYFAKKIRGYKYAG